MKIRGLTVETANLAAGNHRAIIVDLTGVSANDLLACADDKLIDELLDAIGEDRVVEHFDLPTDEE